MQAPCRVPLSSFWFWKQDFPLHPYTPPDTIGSSRKLRLSRALQGFFDSLERCEALEIPFRMCRKNTASREFSTDWLLRRITACLTTQPYFVHLANTPIDTTKAAVAAADKMIGYIKGKGRQKK